MTRTNIPHKLITLLLAVVLVSCTSSKGTQQSISSEQQDDMAEIIVQLPAVDQAEQFWLHDRLIEMGAGGIHTLASQLIADGTGDDTYARYALNGLAKHVSRPGAGVERSIYEDALLYELESNHSNSAKKFLMDQLIMTGSDTAVPVLKTFLADEALYESAIEALVAIRTTEAAQAVAGELSGVEGQRLVTLVKALGDMEYSPAVQDIIPYSDSGEWPIKRSALHALAKIGNPEGTETLLHAAEVLDSTQQNDARSFLLSFIQKLADEGHVSESSNIARQVLADAYPVNFKSSALYTLAQNEGVQALGELLQSAGSYDQKFRSAALSLARSVPGQEVTDAFVSNLGQGSPQVTADIVRMLGNRGDSSALSAVVPFLTDNNLAVRLASIQAAASLGGTGVMSELFEALDQAQQPEEIETIKNSLLQLSPNDLLPAVSSAFQTASDQSKVVFIEILAERGASGYLDIVLNQHNTAGSEVRLAVFHALNKLATPADLPRIIRMIPEAQNTDERNAIQSAIVSVSNDIPEAAERADAVLRALNEASDSDRPHLLELLPGIGGDQALTEVAAAVNSSDDAVQNSAILALSEWEDVAAIPALLEVFKTASSSERTRVLEGYVRLVNHSSNPASEKVQLLQDAAFASEAVQEKVIVLRALSEVNDPVALQAVTGYFNDNNETVTQEAVRVTARMLAPPFNSSSNSSNSASATLSLLEGSFGPEIRQQVEQQILEMNADEDMEEGFVSLFNGIDLSGWTGSTDAYKVEDGQIISLTGQSGNLFTEDEYSNFNLKFDFKLTPGANNGIGIRTPSDGHAAYDGMELQVLDNTAEKYADLEAYQYHGSVYGVAAAERGHLNPVGEWNSQEVIARDSQITIILNGETILETDIREASTPHTLDGREHPGLLHDSGHIVLLGHNDEVAFRNIFVQDLDIYLPNYDTDGEESENQDPISRQPIAEVSLFNGQDLAGWERVGVEDGSWHANDGILSTEGEGEEWEMGGGGGWLSTENTYDNFILELEYRIPEGGNSGVFLRAPREGDPAYQGMEIQLLDDGSEQYAGLNPWQYTGSIYDVKAPNKQVSKPAGEWQKMVIVADGPAVSVTLNGEKIINSNLINHMDRVEEHPGLKRRSGYIGLQNHNTLSEFRNIKIRELK